MYPFSPMDTRAAQQAALRAPGRLPAKVGEKYSPPGQSVMVKYWYRRRALPRYKITDVPLAAYPYLWVSAEMEVTPGRWKFTGRMSYPSFSAHGTTNPPR